jgi:outer membrane immunogenic protein
MFGGVQAASAADMAVKARPIAAPIVFNWTGFYVGIEGGGAWASTQWTRPSTGLSTGNFTGNGWLFGGTLGYNWQPVGSNFVWGIEGDISWANVDPVTNIATCLGCGTKLQWFGTLRGRVGYTVMPQALLYATGGLAVGGFEHTITSLPGFSNRTTEAGWTVGGGLEVMIMPNWSLKGEYLYTHFGSQEACPATSTCGGGTVINNDYFRMHIVRAGLNFHF